MNECADCIAIRLWLKLSLRDDAVSSYQE